MGQTNRNQSRTCDITPISGVIGQIYSHRIQEIAGVSHDSYFGTYWLTLKLCRRKLLAEVGLVPNVTCDRQQELLWEGIKLYIQFVQKWRNGKYFPCFFLTER